MSLKNSLHSRSTLNLVFSLLIAIASLIGFASCKSNSTTAPPSGNGGSITKPKLGSSFTDSSYTKDTNLFDDKTSGVKQVYFVIDTNATIYGKSQVYIFRNYDSTTLISDSVFLHYESNGDVAIYVPFQTGSFVVGSEWVTFPFATQSTSAIPTLKTVFTDTLTLSGTVQGTGSGTVNASGSSLTTENVTMTLNASAPSIGTIPGKVMVAFAPSIGFVTSKVITQQGSALGYNLSGGEDQFLLGYSLK